jgi:hypothetical protein
MPGSICVFSNYTLRLGASRVALLNDVECAPFAGRELSHVCVLAVSRNDKDVGLITDGELTTVYQDVIDRIRGDAWRLIPIVREGVSKGTIAIRPERRQRAGDIDLRSWIWTVRRQTTPGPGGLIDKGTKGKRAREVPLIEEIRPMVEARVIAARSPELRLFVEPKGGRISTAVLRDATHWDEVVEALGHEHLVRHDLRHTGLTWMADAGVQVHVLRKIAGHGSITTTQRYPHPDRRSLDAAAASLSAHLTARRSPGGPHLHVA